MCKKHLWLSHRKGWYHMDICCFLPLSVVVENNTFSSFVINTLHAEDLSTQDVRARFNIKMSSYQYRKSHYGDKTVVRSSYLHNGISYTGKMASLYWIRSLAVSSYGIELFMTQYPGPGTRRFNCIYYSDVIMSAMASEITGVSIVCSAVCSCAHQRKHQSWWSKDSTHKGSVTRKCFHLMTLLCVPVNTPWTHFLSRHYDNVLCASPSVKLSSFVKESFPEWSRKCNILYWNQIEVIMCACKYPVDPFLKPSLW